MNTTGTVEGTDSAPAGGGLAHPVSLFVLLLAILLIWHSLGDHALYSPDEGRYATVAMHMADGESWITPQFKNHPHLTKPPLTYWLEAASMRVLGPREIAVRLPSALASTLTLLLLYVHVRRRRGATSAALAVGVLSVMPLFVIVGRLATTDALLSFFWFISLVCGLHAVDGDRHRRRSMLLMWLALAGGLLTKGPLALTPCLVLVIWLLFAGRWRSIGRLWIPVGLPLAAVPLAVWVLLVLREHPAAMDTWRHEIVDRITGHGGDHPEPIWFYVPVFLAGLFPATAMLTIPGWNFRWRELWRKLRAGQGSCFWGLAVVVPLVMLSLISGKVPTYLLPLCPPLAILTASMLGRWVSGEADRRVPGTREPDIVVTLSVAVLLTLIAMLVVAARMRPELLWSMSPLLVLPCACVWLWSVWKRRPQWRSAGLVIVWVAFILFWNSSLELEDEVLEPYCARAAVARLRDLVGREQPRIRTFGFGNPTLGFYNHDTYLSFDRRRDWHPEDAQAAQRPLVVLVDDASMQRFQRKFAELVPQLERVMTWQRTPTHTVGAYVASRELEMRRSAALGEKRGDPKERPGRSPSPGVARRPEITTRGLPH
jgi:4-amino-4-deoxy-L-arabinose transferase-like glycosyltransferase